MDYPEARTEPVEEQVGGIRFADPYRWLEEDSEQTLDWQARQDALASARLRAWPGFAKLCEEIARHSVDARVFAPVRRGKLWFRLALQADRQQPVLEVSGEPTGPGRVLIDPQALSADTPRTLDWYTPSRDGRFVAYGISERGDEQSVLHLLETQSGQVLPVAIPHTPRATVAWLPDSSGFYYNGRLGHETRDMSQCIFFHRLGDATPADPEPLELEEQGAAPQVSIDGRYATVLTAAPGEGVRPTYLKELAPTGVWRRFLERGEHALVGSFIDDRYVALTTEGAARGRVVAIPIETPSERSTWHELIPESDAVLVGLRRVGRNLVVTELVDASSRIRITTLRGEPRCEVPLPSVGTAAVHVGYAEELGTETDFTLEFASFTSSLSTHRFDLETQELETFTEPRLKLEGLRVERARAVSADGTPIPMTLVYREDLDLREPRPALIHGYGGFNIPFVPTYLGPHAPFVLAGGIFVHPNLRGGGEFGREWWHGGRRGCKQNTFDDLYAVAEFLISSGRTSAERLALWGASNGGLLAGAALTQRPDLFRAVLSAVPVLDLMRITRDPFTAFASRNDYGDPAHPDDARVMFAYSPYHNVREGEHYPATLVACGETDVRCRPWHSRKTVARLQHANASPHPILLRIWKNTGHGTGRTRASEVEQTAEWLGFLMRQLGMP